MYALYSMNVCRINDIYYICHVVIVKWPQLHRFTAITNPL